MPNTDGPTVLLRLIYFLVYINETRKVLYTIFYNMFFRDLSSNKLKKLPRIFFGVDNKLEYL